MSRTGCFIGNAGDQLISYLLTTGDRIQVGGDAFHFWENDIRRLNGGDLATCFIVGVAQFYRGALERKWMSQVDPLSADPVMATGGEDDDSLEKIRLMRGKDEHPTGIKKKI